MRYNKRSPQRYILGSLRGDLLFLLYQINFIQRISSDDSHQA